MTRRRVALERGWIIASVLYGCIRITLVWAYLRDYGVNAWAFAGVEVVSSLGYGFASARAVSAVLDATYSRLRAWGPLALVSYLAPDVYIFSSAGRMPNGVLTVVVGVFLVALVTTVIGIISQIRRRPRVG